MPDLNDVYWDELGIAWQALQPVEGLVASRLEPMLRRQSLLVRLGAVAGYPLGVLGLGLAGWCLWVAWSRHAWNFATRGGAIGVVAVMALMAAAALQGALAGEQRSLRGMLELAALRAERLGRAAGLGCAALVALAGGGLAGFVIRARGSHPPAVSPILDLLTLAGLAVALAWLWSSQWRAKGKYRHLARALAEPEGTAGP